MIKHVYDLFMLYSNTSMKSFYWERIAFTTFKLFFCLKKHVCLDFFKSVIIVVY